MANGHEDDEPYDADDTESPAEATARQQRGVVRVVQAVEDSRHRQKNRAFRSQVVCTCGYRDPVAANSFLTKPDAETSAKGHARDTGHTFRESDAS